MAYGSALARDRAAKAKQRHPCPVPEYAEIKIVQQVAEWWRCSCAEAEALAIENPYKFRCVADAANSEREAEPIARKYAEARAKQEAEREKKGKARPRVLGAPVEEAQN